VIFVLVMLESVLVKGCHPAEYVVDMFLASVDYIPGMVSEHVFG